MLLSRHHLSQQRRRGDGTLERSAYLLLSRLSAEGPLSIGQLSEALGVNDSTVHRQTSAMVRAGLIERIADPDGGVARKFQTTEEGDCRLEHEQTDNIDGLAVVMREWTPEEVADFARYLARFNTDIERLDGRPWPRANRVVNSRSPGVSA
ncbi:MarR family winged helix-turn-helix transcriptional regulator [Nocardia sp. XZ_19_231]|uniref:MarR family winged helix-turn-helix transcriptional regulator n=1 Tax=Nocardia sp. XZ_19_231 TaxID=2769252 RepID=UPI001E44009E|nr:MarR family transcriptional regulator [Nocardia sp. XZ_19_231]